MHTKVINLFGAPGTGKSTVAAGLFYLMKRDGFKVELATEWIKGKLFEGTKYPFEDQLYPFAKQNKILRQLVGKVGYIVSDSPILLSRIYRKNEPEVFDQMVSAYFNLYDNVNYLLFRDHPYHTLGRYQTEEESDEIQMKILDMLRDRGIQFDKYCTSGAAEFILKDIKAKFGTPRS